jgi:hypothetical protein
MDLAILPNVRLPGSISCLSAILRTEYLQCRINASCSDTDGLTKSFERSLHVDDRQSLPIADIMSHDGARRPNYRGCRTRRNIQRFVPQFFTLLSLNHVEEIYRCAGIDYSRAATIVT